MRVFKSYANIYSEDELKHNRDLQRKRTERSRSKKLGVEVKIKPFVETPLLELKTRKAIRERLKKLRVGVDITADEYMAARKRMNELLRAEKARFKETHSIEEVRAMYRKQSRHHYYKVKNENILAKFAMKKVINDMVSDEPMSWVDIGKALHINQNKAKYIFNEAMEKIKDWCIINKEKGKLIKDALKID